MSTNQTFVPLIARVMMGVLFVMAGIGKLADVPGFSAFMATGGIPAFLGWPVVLFEIGAGGALIAGLFTRPVALALAAFTLLAGALYHFVPADQMQMTQFLKNVALTGGYLAVAAMGAGQWSLDAVMGKGRIATA